MSIITQPARRSAAFWTLLSPGDRVLWFVAAAAAALVLWGIAVWRAHMPLWGATTIAIGVLAVPATMKWRTDFQRYGLTAVLLSMLLVMQGFHTLEHFSQVIQYYVFNNPPYFSQGLLSTLNNEWVHFTWNWIVVGFLVYLIRNGLRNRWAWVLLVWAFAHSLEHTYMLIRYLRIVRELSALGVTAPPVAGSLPGILGRDGWLALSSFCGRIPGLTTSSRIAIHFWWNFGEMALLLAAVWVSAPKILEKSKTKE
ncbi:MAG: hypothetical protein KDD92_12960 [Caldilineaceae bacterium]|nr:hypothetical protein [Caldilineaceae bacterium]